MSANPLSVRVWIAASVVLTTGACQRYVEVPAAPRSPTGAVRITLTEDAASMPLGPIGSSVRQVEGRVLSVTDSAVSLSVSQVMRRTGFQEQWQGETVSLPRRTISVLEKQEFSVRRTFATVGAIIAGSFLTRGLINGGESTGTPGRKPGGGN